MAPFPGRLERSVIIEFVPKADLQVRRMLARRGDVLPNYMREGLEKAVAEDFTLQRGEPLPGSGRQLYLYPHPRS